MTTSQAPGGGQPLAVGVDVGGTKIATGLVTGDGTVVALMSRPTPTQDADAFIQGVAQSIRQVTTADRASGGGASPVANTGDLRVGVGLPAVIDPGGRRVVWAPNIPALSGVELADRLEHASGLPVTLAYDGHTAGLAEQWVGAGRGVRNMVVLIIGTGIGGAIVADGRLIRGAHGLAGAFGWMTLAFSNGNPGPDPEAARLGWFESRAAGPAILRVARRERGVTSTEEVFNRAGLGDPAARRVLEQIGSLLGAAVSNLVSALDTEMVVLAGGVGAHGELLVPYIRRQIDMWAQPHVRPDVKVQVSHLGPSAGVIGAARLAMDTCGQAAQ